MKRGWPRGRDERSSAPDELPRLAENNETRPTKTIDTMHTSCIIDTINTNHTKGTP